MKYFKNREIFEKFLGISLISVCTMFSTALFAGFGGVAFVTNDPEAIWTLVGVVLVVIIHLLSLFYIMKK